MSGRDLNGLIRDGRSEQRGLLLESRLYSRRKAKLEAYILGRWKLIVEGSRQRGSGRPTRSMLFDREADAAERHDVAAEHPEVVRRLTRLLAEAVANAEQAVVAADRPGEVHLGPEEMAALKALGYVGDGNEAEKTGREK